jgi:hypothetical protein
VLEEMVLPALRKGGYAVETQVHIGTRLGGARHKVDVVARDGRRHTYLISLKWQQTSGTAEQKVPFEVLCLAEAVLEDENNLTRAYLVLGGDGWSLRDFFTGGGLDRHLRHAKLVIITTLESFVSQANRGAL